MHSAQFVYLLDAPHMQNMLIHAIITQTTHANALIWEYENPNQVLYSEHLIQVSYNDY